MAQWQEPMPEWLRFSTWLVFAMVLAGAVFAAVLLALGAADPPKAGPVRWEQAAEPGTCLEAAALDLPVPEPPLTLQLVAESVDHAPWGVALNAGSEALRWEVVPPGYYRYAGETIAFHHVIDGVNVLRLDLDDAHWRLSLNAERAVEGDLDAAGLAWSVLGEAGVCWRRATVYGP